MKTVKDLIELMADQAYTALVNGTLGIATENEAGYHAVHGIEFKTYPEAVKAAEELNKRDGKTMKQAYKIVFSSMHKKL